MDIKRPEGRQPIPPHAKRVFQGELFDVYQWEQKMYDGSTATFEKLKRMDTVSIVPVLPDGKLLIIEDEQPGREKILTFPGGRLDSLNEPPEVAAARELLEETGYAAKEIVLWKAWQPVSKVDWVLYFFVGRGCTKLSEPHLDAGERITSRAVTFDEVIELMKDERFPAQDMKLEFIQAHYDAVERKRLERLFFGGEG